jgi:hypothetical protein
MASGQCANEAVCRSRQLEREKPDGYWSQWAHCLRCRLFAYGTMEAAPTAGACAACAAEATVRVRFPAKGCPHWLCASCAHGPIFWKESDADVDPSRFGAPACPNKCSNPDVGEQCGCPEWEEAVERWATDHPVHAASYVAAQDAAYAAHPPPPCGPRTCPVCAKKMRGD